MRTRGSDAARCAEPFLVPRLTAMLREQRVEAAKLDVATCLRRGFGSQVTANLKELGYDG